MKLRVGWILVAALVVPAALPAQSGRVVLVLDGSNSMWGRIDGVEKIVVARDVLSEVLAALPPAMQVGLAAYGHRRENACDDIEMLLSPGEHPQAEVEAAIRGVQPRGMTPITGALQLVADGLQELEGPTHLVLVSDGKETCEGDPCALVRSLVDSGIDLTVHVVGFDVTEAESEQLRCVAEAGRGVYASAGTAEELIAALGEIRKTVVEQTDRFTQRRHWSLQAGDDSYEGDLVYATRNGDRLSIQLVNLDGVNLGIRLPGEGANRREAQNAFFAVGRGAACQMVFSDPRFEVTFETNDEGWVSGTFAGTLACPDYSALPVKGSFQVQAPGE